MGDSDHDQDNAAEQQNGTGTKGAIRSGMPVAMVSAPTASMATIAAT